MVLTPELSTLTMLGVAFAASLTGSLHCLGMCGPLRLLVNGPGAGMRYQAGRLAAYLSLGTLAGLAGLALPLPIVLALVILGILGTFTNASPMPAGFTRWRGAVLARASKHPALLGFASGLLPCGLLHGWIAAAAALGSPAKGAAVLLMLWMGSLPALEAGSRALRAPFEAARRKFPRGVPVALLLLALLPLGLRMGWISHAHDTHAPEANSKTTSHCH